MLGISTILFNLACATTLANPFDCWNADNSFSAEKAPLVTGNLLAFHSIDLPQWLGDSQKETAWISRHYQTKEKLGRTNLRKAIVELHTRLQDQNNCIGSEEMMIYKQLRSELQTTIEKLSNYYGLARQN